MVACWLAIVELREIVGFDFNEARLKPSLAVGYPASGCLGLPCREMLDLCGHKM